MEARCYRILLVDDEKSILGLLMAMFCARGFECVAASDGLEALDRITKGRFDNEIISSLQQESMETIENLKREIENLKKTAPGS